MKFCLKYLFTLILIYISISGWSATSDKTVFALEEISVKEFKEAELNQNHFYDNIFRYSVLPTKLTALVITDARNRFEQLDSLNKEDYDIDAPEYDNVFSVNSLIYIKSLKMYWLPIPTIHDAVVYCYDSESGEFLGEILYPFTVSADGTIVAQKGYDCDWPLDLHFYKRTDEFVYEYFHFKTLGYFAETIMDNESAKNWDLPTTTFWIGNNTLYISMYNTTSSDKCELVYLKLIIPD